MSSIKLEKLTKRFGKQTAVKELSLDIREREFVAILGPSGCGKTTTMNMISGLLKPDSGEVYYDGKVMNNIPPGKRGVGFVFQNYAVFTHMTAYDNISCGLKVRGVSKEEIREKVSKFAKMLKIEPVLGMNAGKLSINDMQKVAIARTMVTEPSILLLDEPLSNLDAALRNMMRAELKRIHHELGQTTIYVTHDQIEAMSLADKIAVMNFAVLQQFAKPDEIYNRPVNLFVANFIGSPTMNFFKGLYKSGVILLVNFENEKVELSAEYRNRIDKVLRNQEVVLGVRPEHLHVTEKKGSGELAIQGRVMGIEPLGSETIVYLGPSGGKEEVIIKSIMDSDYKTESGMIKTMIFKERDIYLFDAKTEELILRF